MDETQQPAPVIAPSLESLTEVAVVAMLELGQVEKKKGKVVLTKEELQHKREANRLRTAKSRLKYKKPAPVRVAIQPKTDDEGRPVVLTEIGKFVNRLLKCDLREWKDKIDQRVEVCLVLEKALAKNIMQEKSGRGDDVVVKADEERTRWWSIYWIGNDGERTKLFEVKKSTILNARYGLFAAQDYAVTEVLGVYYGDKILETKKGNDKAPNEYAMFVTWPPKAKSRTAKGKAKKKASTVKQNRFYVIPKGGPASDLKDTGLSFFGFHMANDPSFGLPKRRLHPNFNIAVLPNLTVIALTNIKAGEELFLDYNIGDN